VSEEPASYAIAACTCGDSCAALRLTRANRRLRSRVQRLEARVAEQERAHLATLGRQAQQLEDALREIQQHRATVRHLHAMREAAVLLRQALITLGGAAGFRHTRDPQAKTFPEDASLLCRWCRHPDHGHTA